jgi:hypothetical protein
MGNIISAHIISTATIPKTDSSDSKRANMKISSNRMVKPPTHAEYGNVEVALMKVPWSRT